MRDITLENETGMRVNIRIDERQKMIETLQVLIENGKIAPVGSIPKVYSQRKQRYVNALLQSNCGKNGKRGSRTGEKSGNHE